MVWKPELECNWQKISETIPVGTHKVEEKRERTRSKRKQA